MMQKARDLGFDTSVLVDVKQQGCTYEYMGKPLPA